MFCLDVKYQKNNFLIFKNIFWMKNVASYRVKTLLSFLCYLKFTEIHQYSSCSPFSPLYNVGEVKLKSRFRYPPMPARKGLLAPQNTFLDTIATRFDGTRKFVSCMWAFLMSTSICLCFSKKIRIGKGLQNCRVDKVQSMMLRYITDFTSKNYHEKSALYRGFNDLYKNFSR